MEPNRTARSGCSKQSRSVTCRCSICSKNWRLIGPPFSITLNLSPILLEQLADPYFKTAFIDYLNERIERADATRLRIRNYAIWPSVGDRRYSRRGKIRNAGARPDCRFRPAWKRRAHRVSDVGLSARVSAVAAERPDDLGSTRGGARGDAPASAGRTDRALAARVRRIGRCRHSGDRRCFTKMRGGAWAWSISSPTVAPIIFLSIRRRCGATPVDAQQPPAHRAGIVADALSAVRVVSPGDGRSCAAPARNAELSSQIWSSTVGYPAAGAYLEFHRRLGDDGLRYHRVTDPAPALQQKRPYELEAAFLQIYQHVAQFRATVRQLLGSHRDSTGEPGICVAAFDAELFGHWWHEGPTFLRDLLFMLQRDSDLRVESAGGAMQRTPAITKVELPESSWGRQGDHRVWLNDETRWLWEIEYRSEGDFLKYLHALPGASSRTSPTACAVPAGNCC